MNRINGAMNGVVVALVLGACGYLAYSSGFSLPGFSQHDDAWFRAEVLEAKQPVVVKFGASWCRPCRMMEPELDQLESSGRVKVVRINVDSDRELAQRYQVSSIPDVILFQHGRQVARRVGYADYNELMKWVGGHAMATAAAYSGNTYSGNTYSGKP